MSGQQPRLPPGISLQRSVEPPNLPPGVSIQRSSENKLANLPSSIQVQKSSGNNATESNINRLAGLGIKISRSEEGNTSPMDRLSGLGVSVSGGPSPVTRLPPGLSISGGPAVNSPRLPPGISVSGGNSSVSRLPPGINVSGGNHLPIRPGGGPGPPQPRLGQGPGVTQRPGATGQQQLKFPQNGQTQVRAQNVPDGFQQPRNHISGTSPLRHPIGPAGPRSRRPSSTSSSGPSPTRSPAQTPPPTHPSQGTQLLVQQGPGQSNHPTPSSGADPRSSSQPVPISSSQSQALKNVQISNSQLSQYPNVPAQHASQTRPLQQQEKQQSVPAAAPVDHETRYNQDQESQDSVEPNRIVKHSELTKIRVESPVTASEFMSDVQLTAPMKPVLEDSDIKEKSMKQGSIQPEVSSTPPEQESELITQNEGKPQETEEVDMNPEESSELHSDRGEAGSEAEAKSNENDEPAEDAGEPSKVGDGGKDLETEENYNEEYFEEGYEGFDQEEGYEEYGEGEGYEGYEDGEYENYEEEDWTEEEEKADKNAPESKSGDKPGNDPDGAPPTNDDDTSTNKPETIPEESENKDDTEEESAKNEDEYEEQDEEEDSAPAPSPSKRPGSATPLPNLPPGISISNPGGTILPPGITISGSSTPALPPGISISPFKKPSNRQSTDDDARSTNSNDRSSDISDSYSRSADRNLRVGSETTCVMCMNKCAERRPRLLTCLHSACYTCFFDKLAESRREENSADVVDLDGDGIMSVPEVVCPICRATTTESETMENYFILDHDEDRDEGNDDDLQYCSSCEENAVASSKCVDCDEFLCSDCVRAHQRVKMTKDHQIAQVKSSQRGSSHYKYCSQHHNERLTLYCESCDILNCRDCQLSERHRNCKYRYSYEVAPEVKGNLHQSSSDIRLKKSHIEESVGILSTKISEVNIKERSLLAQLKEVKNFIISKVEDRYRELTTEVTKRTRDKRKTLEARKNNLDRSFWQAEYALSFIDHVVNGNIEDEKLLLSKKLVMRQMKRLKRVNQAVNLPPSELEFKLDLYFQSFSSQSLHSNLASVVRMTLADIKVSSIPIEAHKPKAPPPAQPAPTPSPIRQPVTPNRTLALPSPGQGMGRGSPVNRGNLGGVVRQLATPTKAPRPVMKNMSPARSMIGQQAGRGAQRVQIVSQRPMGAGGVRGRGRGNKMQAVALQGINSPGMGGMNPGMGGMGGMGLGRGSPALGGRGQNPRGLMKQAGMVMGQGMRGGRAQPMLQGQQGGMMRGGGQGQQMRGVGGRMRGQLMQQQNSRRGRPATESAMMQGGAPPPRFNAQNQQYTNAALGLNSPAFIPNNKQQQLQRRQQQQQQQKQQMLQQPQQYAVQQQSFSPIQQQAFPQSVQLPARSKPVPQVQPHPQVLHVQSNAGALNTVPAGLSIQPVATGGNSLVPPSLASPGSSWHTPSNANRPASPPQMPENSFKITLPKMAVGGGLGNLKKESSPEIIDLDSSGPSKIPAHLNISRIGSHPQMGPRSMDPNIPGSMNPSIQGSMDPSLRGSMDQFQGRPGMNISKVEEGVDPLGDESQRVGSSDRPMVSLNMGAVKTERTPGIKTETRIVDIRQMDTKININKLPAPARVMEGSAQKDRTDGDWCAVCHDGGDTLYCCDRCPKVYHLYCYIPPLSDEPADDWVCLSCSSRDEIFSLSTKVRKGRGALSERDIKICRRLLLEMYNLWPESVPFRDCADLNFPQYLEKIKEPIAMDVIKDRLAEESPQQYTSVKLFLADLRKMFRNCFTFNQRDTEIYKHAKKMEEKLDALLEVWVPEFANDPLINVGTKRPGSPRAGPSKKKRPGSAAGAEQEKKKRGRKKKKPDSDFDDASDSDDGISEGERERQQYTQVLAASVQDQDPDDDDYAPDDSRGKGKGRGKGRK